MAFGWRSHKIRDLKSRMTGLLCSVIDEQDNDVDRRSRDDDV